MPSAETHPQSKPAFVSSTPRSRDPDTAPSSSISVPPKPRRERASEQESVPPKTPADATDPETPSRRRCVACGNVFHFKLSYCTSCCRQVTDAASWEPASAPTPGAVGETGEPSDASDALSSSEDDASSTFSGTADGDGDSGSESDSEDDSEEGAKPAPRERERRSDHRGVNRAVTDALFGA
jgi:hypothetical protein